MSEIGRLRDSAGMMQIGDGTGAITGSYVLDDRFLVIRNDSVYAVQMADQIDPDRTNPDIPNINQRLFDVGSDSELIRRTLLTANELFKRPYLADTVDDVRARAISLDVTHHLLPATTSSEALSSDIVAALVSPISVVGRSAQLPSVGGLWPRFAAMFQSIEHALQEMYQLALLFFPEATRARRYFEGFRDVVRESMGEDTNFYRFSAALAANGVFIRNVRACIEHEREEQRLVIRDFEMSPTGAIERPTIEIIHPATPHPRADLAVFCADLAKQTLDGFESLCAHCAAVNINPSLPVPTWIDRVPEDQRRPDRSDIGYLVNLGGQITRFG